VAEGRFTGKVLSVTGGGSGIGAEVADVIAFLASPRRAFRQRRPRARRRGLGASNGQPNMG
jgi:NAD(P)-dependent dehydrogenase (short-subunit alcohol dehydrogenase family)